MILLAYGTPIWSLKQQRYRDTVCKNKEEEGETLLEFTESGLIPSTASNYIFIWKKTAS